jgi:hypothetical protein
MTAEQAAERAAATIAAAPTTAASAITTKAAAASAAMASLGLRLQADHDDGQCGYRQCHPKQFAIHQKYLQKHKGQWNDQP